MSSEAAATSTKTFPQTRNFRLGSGIVHRSSPLVRRAILAFGRSIGWIFFSLRVEGSANLPKGREPLIVISNHFGWFDAFILTLYLPFQPVFLVATESQRKWYVRFFMNLFDGIPIWRGQVDREAFRSAIKVLDEGRPLGVFPEGGINPELADRAARGEQIVTLTGPTSRVGGALVRAKPGTALLATMSHKRILPIALLGSDRIGSNLRHLRRTVVTMRIGPIFGPMAVDGELTGPARRARIDEMSDDMMREIARLFPTDRRGPYAGQL